MLGILGSGLEMGEVEGIFGEVGWYFYDWVISTESGWDLFWYLFRDCPV